MLKLLAFKWLLNELLLEREWSEVMLIWWLLLEREWSEVMLIWWLLLETEWSEIMLIWWLLLQTEWSEVMLIGDLSQLNSLDLFQNPLLQYLHSNDSPCLFSIYNIIIVALFCFSPTFFARKISSFFVYFSNKVVKPKCKKPFSRLIKGNFVTYF